MKHSSVQGLQHPMHILQVRLSRGSEERFGPLVRGSLESKEFGMAIVLKKACNL